MQRTLRHNIGYLKRCTAILKHLIIGFIRFLDFPYTNPLNIIFIQKKLAFWRKYKSGRPFGYIDLLTEIGVFIVGKTVPVNLPVQSQQLYKTELSIFSVSLHVSPYKQIKTVPALFTTSFFMENYIFSIKDNIYLEKRF